jgi:hypothetical protein
MLRGSCHCGAVSFRLNTAPEWLTECNCSICRRIGGLWAHAEIEQIVIEGGRDATLAYSWGDRNLAFHTCRTCGCTTHWENLHPEKSSRMAVNGRMAAPADIAGIRIRRFDGADTWTYLD